MEVLLGFNDSLLPSYYGHDLPPSQPEAPASITSRTNQSDDPHEVLTVFPLAQKLSQ